MPYRALTHGRVKNPILDLNGNLFTPVTHSQASAISSQNGVANNGPVSVQRNKNNQSNKRPKRNYTRTLSVNFLMRPNAYGNPNTFVSGQGKGFPNATPQISVGSTNKFSRRAIARRAVTRTIDPLSRGCCDDYCPTDTFINITNNNDYIVSIYTGLHHAGFVDKTFQTELRQNLPPGSNNYVLDSCNAFGAIAKHTHATYNGRRIFGLFRWLTNNFMWSSLSQPTSVVLMLEGTLTLAQCPTVIINGSSYSPLDIQTGNFTGMLNNAAYTVIRYGDSSNNLDQLFVSQKQNDITVRFS